MRKLDLGSRPVGGLVSPQDAAAVHAYLAQGGQGSTVGPSLESLTAHHILARTFRLVTRSLPRAGLESMGTSTRGLVARFRVHRQPSKRKTSRAFSKALRRYDGDGHVRKRGLFRNLPYATRRDLLGPVVHPGMITSTIAGNGETSIFRY